MQEGDARPMNSILPGCDRHRVMGYFARYYSDDGTRVADTRLGGYARAGRTARRFAPACFDDGMSDARYFTPIFTQRHRAYNTSAPDTSSPAEK